MIEATKKLREPAGFALVVSVAVVLLFSIIDLLFSESGTGASGIAAIPKFADRAAASTGNFLDPLLAVLLVVAVVLVNGLGAIEGRTRQAKVVTLVALIDFGVALLFGVISLFSTFGSDASGRDNISSFFVNIATGAVVGVAAWFTWLVYQGHMPARPATGWQGGPSSGYQPQQQGWGGPPQQQGGYQAPPPGGYGFPQQPQPPAPPQGQPPQTQFIPPTPGGQPPQPPMPPQPPQGGEPGNSGQTQVFPPVGGEPPTTTADQSSGEQPWSPGGNPWSPQG
jgi:hypothetical protein